MRASDRDAGNRAWATYQLGNLEMLHGRLAARARLVADARAQDMARGAPPSPLRDDLSAAWVDIWFREQPARGVQELDAALARSRLRTLRESDRPYLWAAALYALAGRPDRARALLVQYAAEVHDSALIRQQEPERHDALAEVALAELHPIKALTEFKLGDRRADGPVDGGDARLPANLGRAYDVANMPDSAVAMYERYLATPPLFGPWQLLDASQLAGIHKRLGELYDAKGDRDKAVGHYLHFVELWKNADPVLQPKVAQVKRGLGHLRDAERR